MSIWKTLGIQPTGNLEAIKRAYAEQAKRYHPEEHPDEFRALHDAYRQATRYARQHPDASPRSTAASVPAAPAPAFKPSYHIPLPTDNPCRSSRYYCADNECSAAQFEDIRRENKDFTEPRKPPMPPPTLPHGKLPIRGSGASPEPSGSLQFDVLEQMKEDAEADDPPADAPPPPEVPQPPEAPIPPSVAPAKQAHPFAKTGLLLALWMFFASLAFESVHPVLLLVLYGILCIYLFRTIEQRMLLSFCAAAVDFLTCAFLSDAARQLPAPLM
ncbi:MAG: J domain-containing protein, partial [Butyricicoccus sp.]